MTLPIPIAGYSFDAQTGEDEIGAYDLNATGAVFTANAKHGAYAVGSGAFGFSITTANVTGVSGPPFTLAAWLYIPTGGTASGDAWSSMMVGLQGTVSGGAAVVQTHLGATLATTANTGTQGAWNLLVFGQRADGVVWLSLNGGAIAESAPRTAQAPQQLTFSSGYSGARFDTGAFWTETLDATEIAWLWNGGAGRTIADLVAAGASHDLTATGLTTGAPTLGTPLLWDYSPLTPVERTAVIAAETRAWAVKQEVRVTSVAEEDRTQDVAAEIRVVPAR